MDIVYGAVSFHRGLDCAFNRNDPAIYLIESLVLGCGVYGLYGAWNCALWFSSSKGDVRERTCSALEPA